MTKVNFAKSKKKARNKRSLLIKILLVGGTLMLLQLSHKANAAANPGPSQKHREATLGGPSKKTSNSIVKGANATLRGSRALYCTSPSSAPVYLGQSGRWTLQGEVVSDYTLKGVTLKNIARKDIGSNSDHISRDQRISDERVFKLQPDVFCNYEVNLPRDFSGEKKFRARLVETCDNLFDGSAELNCSVRD